MHVKVQFEKPDNEYALGLIARVADEFGVVVDYGISNVFLQGEWRAVKSVVDYSL